MSSKTKKNKKRPKPANDDSSRKIQAYFTTDEIIEIKTTMKIKDATGVPLIIAATCLHKFDLLKKLLKDGTAINQTGQNNMTALMWAVKHKHLDIVEYLLNNGADPTIKTDSGDNILILALEHKLWDETSMVSLWKAVKRVSFIDVNFTNKHGHNILHMCVRRDWEQLLKILLLEKPNVDAANFNGVTPLMLACFRNNLSIIDILMEAGADILKEDNHGRMTLCYAISSSMKLSRPPFLTPEKIIIELKKKNSLECYLERRLQLIIATAKKSEVSCATSEMLTKIIYFAVQYMDDGICTFLNSDVFTQLLEVLEARLGHPAIVKFLLGICEEVLFYNEQSAGYSRDLHNQLLEKFNTSGLIPTILQLLRDNTEESKTAFNLLLLGFRNDDCWKQLLQDNCSALLIYFSNYYAPAQDDIRSKILRDKKYNMMKAFEALNVLSPSTTDRHGDERKKSNSKKSRRRSKAIKAKLTKIKSAELTKRLSLNGKKLMQQKSKVLVNSDKNQIIVLDIEEIQDPIVTSLQQFLSSRHKNGTKKSGKDEWKNMFLEMNLDVCEHCSIDHQKFACAVDHLRAATNGKSDENTTKSVNDVVDYLKELVQIIVRKYREYWENDRTNGTCKCLDFAEHAPWLYDSHLKKIEMKEKEAIQKLKKNVHELLKSLRDLAAKDLKQFLRSARKIEFMILSYEIRGIKVQSYVCGSDAITIEYGTRSHQSEKSMLDHMQNVLNDFEPPRNDLEIEIVDQIDDVSFLDTYKSETPMDLYYKEMSSVQFRPRNKHKDVEAKLNTMANGFHLINSIMALCDDSRKPEKFYGISDLNPPLRCRPHKIVHFAEISEYMPQRLKSQISSLQSTRQFQKLLGGAIRIAPKEQKVNYIISAGTNFNAVELGLDVNNQPLAVKRIQRESWVGKIIKTLVEPLLGLMGTHLLHYFACEYQDNELILATPLCKWTMTQHIQLLRQSSDPAIPGLTAVQIVKQFLDGLAVLHKCEMPIVHGNLKPSNIFIDFNGVVKIAEFGIHKALYKIIEAPKSSLIWFAKETLDIYQSSSIVECSLKSDIQVAGMLVYFILTCGKHPFGDDNEDILKNIQKGMGRMIVRNNELKNLLLWMMSTNFNERPHIEQVLSHPFFWSTSKKWNFVLCCSGVNQTGYILPFNAEKLYRSIDTFSEPHIKLQWHELVAEKLPTIRINETNNLVGLLKYIKYCHEHQMDINLCDSEISGTILSLFPSLPVALYRTLQHTNWLKHTVFVQFVDVF